MEKESSPFDMIKVAMNMGLLLGLYNIVKFLLTVMGVQNETLSLLANVLTLAVPLVAILLMRSYRNSPAGGDWLGISKMWSFGTMLFLFASLVSGIVEYSYLTYIDPQFLAVQMENAKALLREMAATDNDGLLSMLSGSVDGVSIPTAIEYVVQSIWTSFFMGAVLSLVLAPIVVFIGRRENRK